MPVKLSALRDKSRTQEVKTEWEGEELTLHYRPGVWTPEFEDILKDPEKGTEVICDALAELLGSWDVLDENDQPIEPTVENTIHFPAAFLLHCMTVCWEDMSPGEARRPSRGGYRRRA